MVQPAVSVVLSTFNRADSVARAIEALLSQREPPHAYEIIVVDNNSTDATADVVKEASARPGPAVRYVFEGRQGLSHARNAGIAASLAPIVAFTDDDVCVSREWVGEIRQVFAAHPEIECVGGRTLPIWPAPPPPWLTSLHWVGPLALQDYGDEPFTIDARRPLCLAGANLVFRKSAFARIGGFSPEFRRAQDTECLVRLWRAGGKSLYVPSLIVHAHVQPERLTKSYHRRWHMNIGRWNARMRLEELSDPVLGLRPAPWRPTHLFGTPSFVYRQFVREVWSWAWHRAAGREARAFYHENRMRALVGYSREWRAMRQRKTDRAHTATPSETIPTAPVGARSEM